MSPAPPILEFRAARLARTDGYDQGLFDASFALAAGELALIRLEPPAFRLPLADAAAGLAVPTRGQVLFDGVDWSARTHHRAADARAGIGRAFDHTSASAWLSDRSLEDNLLLAPLHHTRRKPDEIRAEACGLARVFGLPGLPRFTPDRGLEADLRRAGCVRAFLGAPRLIILERPTTNVGIALLAPIINSVNRARERGAAVLWTTTDSSVFDEPAIHPTLRGRMSGSQLLIRPAETAAET